VVNASRAAIPATEFPLGYRELADEASRDLPDLIDVNRLAQWGIQHGITLNDLISESGGSP